MVFALLAFLIIVCFCTHGYMKKKYRYFEDLGIPFIPPVPLLGNMARTVLRLQHNHETVKDFYNYKPEAKYIGIFNFMRPVIVVRDPEIIKNITVKVNLLLLSQKNFFFFEQSLSIPNICYYSIYIFHTNPVFRFFNISTLLEFSTFNTNFSSSIIQIIKLIFFNHIFWQIFASD